MSIKEVALERQKQRAECRVVADEIMAKVLDRLDLAPDDHQGQIVAMVVTELQIVLKKATQREGR